MTTIVLNRLETIRRLALEHGHKAVIVGSSIKVSYEWVKDDEEGEDWDTFTGETTVDEFKSWLGY